MSRKLPSHPNLEFLRKQAKELLREMQQRDPDCKLTDAQHALARDYGFPSWPKLKAHLELTNPFVGTWIANVSKSRQHPLNPFRTATLDIGVTGDMVTITDTVEEESGRPLQATSTLQADGLEHASEERKEYTVLARWLGSHILEVVVRKNSKVEGRVMYEVSGDGTTLTITTADQVIVCDRR